MKLKRCVKGHIYDEIKYTKCPYCEDTENKKEEEIKEYISEKTIIYNDTTSRKIVGWLVCIYGPNKGVDYKIYEERNFIGRNKEMEISISLDNSVEDKNHCSITYNPKQRIFVITPGNGKGLIYVKNKALYETKELNNFDVIEIGKSRFIFVEFCGNNFDWD